jgi:RNA polymerase sigma-54 factor
MALELRLQQKLTQQLIMTPQLQMAIKLLQLSRLELVDAIRQELDENPTWKRLWMYHLMITLTRPKQ